MGHTAIVERLLAAGADVDQAENVSRVLLCSSLLQLHSFCLHDHKVHKALLPNHLHILAARLVLVGYFGLELLGDLLVR